MRTGGKGKEMRRESRKKETKRNDGRIQSENIFVIVWLSFPSIDPSQETDEFAPQKL